MPEAPNLIKEAAEAYLKFYHPDRVDKEHPWTFLTGFLLARGPLEEVSTEMMYEFLDYLP